MNCTGINCPMQVGAANPAECPCVLFCPNATPPKSKTNYDNIRAMTVEELARWFYTIFDDIVPWCDEARGHHEEIEGCEKCMIDWLKQEVE